MPAFLTLVSSPDRQLHPIEPLLQRRAVGADVELVLDAHGGAPAGGGGTGGLRQVPLRRHAVDGEVAVADLITVVAHLLDEEDGMVPGVGRELRAGEAGVHVMPRLLVPTA